VIDDIRIAMSEEAFLERNCHSAEDELTPFD
jgi:hypothetical protein